ncbi:MAG: acetylglutamate kinase [Pseudomonadota bacterium]
MSDSVKNQSKQNNKDTRETIVQLLSNMTDGKEIRSYLQRFSEVQETQFAVIKVGGAVLRDQLEETAAAIAFLHTVGLTPIVIHGGGPQLDAALAERKIETPKIDGLRTTSAAAMDVARDIFIGQNIALVDAVRAQGVEADGLVCGVIEADYLDKEKFGYVGQPSNVRKGMLESAVNSGAVPILTCIGVAPGGQMLNVNGDAATRAVVDALQPMKVIFLTGVGGLLDQEGEVIHSINLATDFDSLVAADWVNGGMELKLREIHSLLEGLPLSSSVSLTNPSGLVRELFTHGGAGTLVRMGETVRTITDKADADVSALSGMIENAFSRRLKEDWWTTLDFHEAILSSSYRAGAILSRGDDFIYLDKFAVTEDARGEGLSRTVWREMLQRNPRVFWRSRTTNGFNTFYHNEATGSIRAGEWTIFWIAKDQLSDVAGPVKRIAELPDTFQPDN